MDNLRSWNFRARHKFVWDMATIQNYVEVLAESVYFLIKENSDGPIILVTPEIGFFPITNDDLPSKPIIGYAIYIADIRLSDDKRRTLYSDFKRTYRFLTGAEPIMGSRAGDEQFMRALFPPDQAEVRINKIRSRSNLIKDFNVLANKSLNRHRAVSPKIRYQVLMRDDSTCQVCGRRAPEVRVHVDHIRPVVWGADRRGSNNPDEYQVLCEDCNLGKGGINWLLVEP